MAINFNSNNNHGNGAVKHVVFQNNGTSSKAGRIVFGKKTDKTVNYFAEQVAYNNTTQQISTLLPCFEAILISRIAYDTDSGSYRAYKLGAFTRTMLRERDEVDLIAEGQVFYGDRIMVFGVPRAGYLIKKAPSWIQLVDNDSYKNYATSDSVKISTAMYNNIYNGAYSVDANTTALPSNINTSSSSFNFNDLFPAAQFTYTSPSISLQMKMDSSIEKITVRTQRYAYSFLSTNPQRTLNRTTDYLYSELGNQTFIITDEFEPDDIVNITVHVVSSLGSSWFMENTSFTWIVGGTAIGDQTQTSIQNNDAVWTLGVLEFSALSYANLKDRTLKFIGVNNDDTPTNETYLGSIRFEILNTETHTTGSQNLIIGRAAGENGAWVNPSLTLSASSLVVSGEYAIARILGNNASLHTVSVAIQYGNQVQTTFVVQLQDVSGGAQIAYAPLTAQEIGYINYPTDNTTSSSGSGIHDNIDFHDISIKPGGGGIIITPPYNPGGGGTMGCVERNTPIMVSDSGDTLAACDLKIGDVIIGWKNGKIVPTKIIQKYVAREIKKFVRLYLNNKTLLEITPNHPVLCEDGVYRAYQSKEYEKLTLNHKIQIIDGAVEIVSMDLVELEPETVINFLTETDNFIATEVVVGAESPDVKGYLVVDQFGRMVEVTKKDDTVGGINW